MTSGKARAREYICAELLEPELGDEQHGDYTRARLLQMNQRFAERMGWKKKTATTSKHRASLNKVAGFLCLNMFEFRHQDEPVARMPPCSGSSNNFPFCFCGSNNTGTL
jgi:hypothetical protein